MSCGREGGSYRKRRYLLFLEPWFGLHIPEVYDDYMCKSRSETGENSLNSEYVNNKLEESSHDPLNLLIFVMLIKKHDSVAMQENLSTLPTNRRRNATRLSYSSLHHTMKYCLQEYIL